MFLVSCCSCLCPMQWSQVLSRKWICNWSSADRRCSIYTWVIDNFIAYKGANYIRELTVYTYHEFDNQIWFLYFIFGLTKWLPLILVLYFACLDIIIISCVLVHDFMEGYLHMHIWFSKAINNAIGDIYSSRTLVVLGKISVTYVE